MQGMKRPYHPARDEIALANILGALSDPIRLRLVLRVAEEGEAPCNVFAVGIAKSTASHHFKVLREAGVTRTKSEGTRLLISLRRDDLEFRFPGLLQTLLDAARHDETLHEQDLVSTKQT
jgi:DNA-binding transcriptional ArsR family regulator